MGTIEIRSLAEWHDCARDRCEKSYENRLNGRPSECGEGFFKQFLVEAHGDRLQDRQRDAKTKVRLEQALKREGKKGGKLTVRRVEEGVFAIELKEAQIVADCRNLRYWSLETVTESAKVKSVVERATSDGGLLDQLWLPVSLQDALVSSLADGPPPLEGGGPGLRSTYMRTIRTTSMAVGGPQAAISNVGFSGQLTHRGSDWAGILRPGKRLCAGYGTGIQAVERRRLGLGRGGAVSGQLIRLTLPTNPLNPDELQAQVFDRRSIYQLLLTWSERSGTNGWSFDVVDLHTGNALQIGWTEDETGTHLHLSIPDGACGNVVPRLLTNLQQHVDATASCPVFDAASVKRIWTQDLRG